MKKILTLFAFLVAFTLSAQDYTSTISSYLNANRTQLALQPDDVADINVSSQAFSKSMQLDNVYVSQYYQGIEVDKTSSSFAIKDGVVRKANLAFEQNIATRVNKTTATITPQAAVTNAISALQLGTPQSLELIQVLNNNHYEFNKAGISLDNITAKLMYSKVENALILSWRVAIYTKDGMHHYLAMIDANTGALVNTDDLVLHCSFGTTPHAHNEAEATKESFLFQKEEEKPAMIVDGSQYRVFPLPAESPNHGPQALISEPADPIASPFGWHDTNGAVGPEFTITRGNNVYAQDDFDGDNGTFGDAPDGGSDLDFDFPLTVETSPRNNIDGATVNLFYMNNVMHDIWYQYGFDEASGNYQENNYGNGGSGGDSVIADAQDGSGLNNATFGSNVDGGNGRMNMFLWTAPAGDIGQPLTITGGPLAGSYDGIPGGFGGPLPQPGNPISADLALVVDNDAGASTDPQDACDPITNAGGLNGNIAVIRRGECEFGFKVLAAENAGAIAAIVVNNEAGDPITMGAGDVGGQVTIPSIMVNQADGEALITALLNGDTISAELIEVPPFQKDGSLDNGIVAHEYGHGISTRLTGGRFNSGCLQNEDQMGEGWSDWFALMITMEAGQDGTERRGIGTFATNQATDGQGIRNFPYSTDTAENPVTFGDTNSNAFSRPHGIGSIWASMIWDLTWRLVDEYGFDPDFYNGTGGNNLAMQLVIDGLKLQSCNPGFVDGRDAILEADELANGGANRCAIWETFAARGLGVDADQGSPFDRFDQVEAFNVPTGPNCLLSVADSAFANNFSVFPNPSKGTLNINSVLDLGDATVTIYDINGRSVFTQDVVLQSTARLDVSALTTGMYVMSIATENFTHNVKVVIE